MIIWSHKVESLKELDDFWSYDKSNKRCKIHQETKSYNSDLQ